MAVKLHIVANDFSQFLKTVGLQKALLPHKPHQTHMLKVIDKIIKDGGEIRVTGITKKNIHAGKKPDLIILDDLINGQSNKS